MARSLQNFDSDPYVAVQNATRTHRMLHGCGAYTFEDGPGLIRLQAELQAHRVLELGTALGYTACCLAHCSPSVEVDTIEADAQHVALARDQIAQSRLAGRVTVHQGQFEQVLPGLGNGYELAFFDGFAPPHHVVRRLRELLTDNGVLVCSNLQLSSGSDARDLRADLDDPHRWQKLPPVEGGRTVVRRKLGH